MKSMIVDNRLDNSFENIYCIAPMNLMQDQETAVLKGGFQRTVFHQ